MTDTRPTSGRQASARASRSTSPSGPARHLAQLRPGAGGQRPAGPQHGVVLHRRAHHGRRRSAVRLGHGLPPAVDGQVVGLGATGGEDDLARVRHPAARPAGRGRRRGRSGPAATRRGRPTGWRTRRSAGAAWPRAPRVGAAWWRRGRGRRGSRRRRGRRKAGAHDAHRTVIRRSTPTSHCRTRACRTRTARGRCPSS